MDKKDRDWDEVRKLFAQQVKEGQEVFQKVVAMGESLHTTMLKAASENAKLMEEQQRELSKAHGVRPSYEVLDEVSARLAEDTAKYEQMASTFPKLTIDTSAIAKITESSRLFKEQFEEARKSAEKRPKIEDLVNLLLRTKR